MTWRHPRFGFIWAIALIGLAFGGCGTAAPSVAPSLVPSAVAT